jgi:penicillin-binding protein 1B
LPDSQNRVEGEWHNEESFEIPVALKFKIPRSALLTRILLSRAGRVFLALCVALFVVGAGTFTYFYLKFSAEIDAKLKAGPFANTALLYACPRPVWVGDESSPGEVASLLRKAGYSGESQRSRMGWYQLRADAIDIYPGPESFFARDGAVIKFEGKKISQIIALRDNMTVNQYQLEPEMVTSLFDQRREKRRMIHYDDLPKHVVNAVLSAEDKRFFEHPGFDPAGIARALFIDIKERRAAQGASTLTMQVARILMGNLKRTWDRKFAEALVTIHLEQKLTKKEIFEYYANSIYVGQHGSFSIHGFAEAAKAFFGKEIGQLTLAETALIAGLPQVPVVGNPIRHPERARQRRNIVLGLMRDNGYITEAEYKEASEAKVRVVSEETESSDAPYFVDLLNEQLQQRLGADFAGKPFKLYSTLDAELQQDANVAIRVGMEEVDKALARRFKGYPNKEYPLAQAAIVVIDPTSGEVRAMVGGRNYGQTQLNRAVAKRQPGSSFKPFVYAAALSNAVQGEEPLITPTSVYVDEPTVFSFDGRTYEPGNFKDQYYGPVTLRQALAKSMNIPTVKIAEQVGYHKVVRLAKNAGMNADIRATPAVALGAYEVTPLEVAAAYTIFANQGMYIQPSLIREVRGPETESVYENRPTRRAVLDPKVAYLMTNLLQEVMRSGTGAGVRARGFWQPAAGKTGSSRDGWFVGYTSKLICAVWVGFDDGKDISLEGARTALPVWTEFMKRAHAHPQYRNVSEFYPPDGVVTVEIDPVSGKLASPACAQHRTEVFVAGTQPLDVCGGGSGGTQIATWDAPERPAETPTPATPGGGSPAKRESRQIQSIPVNPAPAPAPQEPAKKRSWWDRIRGIVK